MFDPVHTYSVMCLFISDDDRSIWKQLKNGLVKIYSSYSQIFVLTFHILNHHKICRWPKIYGKNNEKHVLSLAQLEAPKKKHLRISGIKIIPSLFISPEKHFFSDHQRRGNSSGNLFKITTTSSTSHSSLESWEKTVQF